MSIYQQKGFSEPIMRAQIEKLEEAKDCARGTCAVIWLVLLHYSHPSDSTIYQVISLIQVRVSAIRSSRYTLYLYYTYIKIDHSPYCYHSYLFSNCSTP